MSKFSDFFAKLWEWLNAAWKWIRTDGWMHIFAVALIVLTLVQLMPLWAADVVAVLVFALKEILDLFVKGQKAEWHDVICDCLGLAYSNAVVCFGWLLTL